MEMKFTKNQRGFPIVEFTDCYNVEGSIQLSSLATKRAIWIGCNQPNPRRLIPGQGWAPYSLPDLTVCDTRLHLTQEQVSALLPILQHFAETGDIPDAPAAGEQEQTR